MTIMPTLFIPHGGGPCFLIDPEGDPADPMWQPRQAHLASRSARLPERPSAVLLVSGHWEEEEWSVRMGGGRPLLFGYHGFPEDTHRLRWHPPGPRDVARRAKAPLAGAGLAAGGE